MKTRDQLLAILTSLVGGWEGECVGFKEAGDGFSTSDIGKYFPLPDFDLTVPGHVILRIQGRFIDENYSRALFAHSDMAWPEVLALDTIQKGSLPDDESLLNLRKQGLIEGRKPNLHVTAEIAAATDSEAEYLHHRAFDDRYFCDLIVDYLKTFGSAKRPKFNRLLESKVSDLLTPAQKRGKIDRLLKRLQAEGRIRLSGYGKGGMWTLNPPASDGPKTHKNAFDLNPLIPPASTGLDLPQNFINPR